MFVSVQVLEKLSEAREHLDAGRVEQARAVVADLDAFIQERQIMNPLERLHIDAAAAKLARECGDTEEAVRRLEKVCALALEIEPHESETLGDLCDLALAYAELGRSDSALATWRRARSISALAHPRYLPQLDAEIEACYSMIEPPVDTGLRVRVRCPMINYSLAHAGLPVIATVAVENPGRVPISESLRVVVPGFAVPTEGITVEVPAGGTRELFGDLFPTFVLERLLTQDERVSTRVEVHGSKGVLASCETWILPYAECSLEPNHEPALATFVQPNNPAVRMVCRQASESLRDTGSFRTLRESTRPDAVDLIAKAIYDRLADLQLTYDYEPPCWEPHSQRVRFADNVIVDRTGTCLDLMLLFASALENALAGSQHPVLVFATRAGGVLHALVGCWRDASTTTRTLVTDRDQLIAWIDSSRLFLMDSTGFTMRGPSGIQPLDFDTCVQRGRQLLGQARRAVAVDLSNARPDPQTGRTGVTPLPARHDPAYSERALNALWAARRAWQASPTTAIQSTHLLIGLLTVESGAATQLFDALATTTAEPALTGANVHRHLTAGLDHIARTHQHTPDETHSFATAKTTARHEATRMRADMIDDMHLQPRCSVTRVLQWSSPSANWAPARQSALHNSTSSHPLPTAKHSRNSPARCRTD